MTAEFYFGGITKFCEGNVSDLRIGPDLCCRLEVSLQVYEKLSGWGRDGGLVAKQNVLSIFSQKFCSFYFLFFFQ